MPTRITARLVTLALLVAAQGCINILFDEHCGPFTRSADANFVIPDGSATPPAGMVSFSEVRDDSIAGTLRMEVFPMSQSGTPLQGRIRSATLLDPSGTTVMELPLTGVSGAGITAYSEVKVRDPALARALHDRIAGGRIVLRLVTDLPGHEEIRAAPSYAGGGNDFTQAYCG